MLKKKSRPGRPKVVRCAPSRRFLGFGLAAQILADEHHQHRAHCGCAVMQRRMLGRLKTSLSGCQQGLYVGFDINADYITAAEQRLSQTHRLLEPAELAPATVRPMRGRKRQQAVAEG